MTSEPKYDPPKLTCCESASATGGAYHTVECPNDGDDPYENARHAHIRNRRMKREGQAAS